MLLLWRKVFPSIIAELVVTTRNRLMLEYLWHSPRKLQLANQLAKVQRAVNDLFAKPCYLIIWIIRFKSVLSGAAFYSMFLVVWYVEQLQ